MTAVMVCPDGLMSGRDFPQAIRRKGAPGLTVLAEHPARQLAQGASSTRPRADH